jgi:hypothetical protein
MTQLIQALISMGCLALIIISYAHVSYVSFCAGLKVGRDESREASDD